MNIKFLVSGLVAIFMAILLGGIITNRDYTPVYAIQACPTTVRITSPLADLGGTINATIGGKTIASLSGPAPIDISGEIGVVKVNLLLGATVIGRAKSVDPTTNGSPWKMIWDTQYIDSGGPYDLFARIRYSDGRVCDTGHVQVGINNVKTARSLLRADMNPLDWTGPTNSIGIFNVRFAEPVNPMGIAQYADVVWSVVGRGSITPEQFAGGRFFAGPHIGTGQVKATVHYGGQTINLVSNINVTAQYSSITTADTTNGTAPPASTTSPASSTPPASTTTTNTDSTLNTTNGTNPTPVNNPTADTANSSPRPIKPAQAIQQVIKSDSTVNACMVDRLGGQDRLQLIIKENRRPNSAEFKKYVSCFERQNFVIPNVLSPVSPENVSLAKQTDSIKVAEIKNDKKMNKLDGSEKTVLILSGNAEANSNVLLYVFSEPLVLATTTDASGNWTYTLEDPLVSGSHEVYALVDGGDGEYQRSSVANFFVGSASATELNPNAYSLELAPESSVTPSNRSVNLIVVATIGTLTFMATIVLSYSFYKFRKPKISKIPTAKIEGASQPIIFEPTKNEEPPTEFNDKT